jgi:hypothetical protein
VTEGTTDAADEYKEEYGYPPSHISQEPRKILLGCKLCQFI